MVNKRTAILPREGFYIDPLVAWIRKSLLNPYLTGPIYIAIRLLAYVQSSGFQHWKIVSPLLRALLYLTVSGSLLSLNEILNSGCLNNWVEDDTWDWNKEIVVVTGGSSGIGASIVQQLLERNSRTTIIVADISPLAFKLPASSNVHYFKCDLSDSADIKNVCEKIRSEIGSPTVLINNAGLTRGKTVMDGTYQDVEMTFRTNIIAPFLLAKEFLPNMVAKDHGHILGISSLSAFISPAGIADYAATKAGMLSLSETLRQELRFKHRAPKVRVSTAVLSFIKTPMFKGETGQSHFIAPLLHVDTVGEEIVNVLFSTKAKTIWLPGIARFLASLRGAPEWMLEAARNASQKLRVDYVGRQKIDPSSGKLQG